MPSSCLVIKTWKILWNFFSRKDLLGKEIACWVSTLSSDNVIRKWNEAGREVRREGQAAVLSLVAILILQDFVLLMLHHLINLCVILKYFAMLWWFETCSLTTQQVESWWINFQLVLINELHCYGSNCCPNIRKFSKHFDGVGGEQL